MNHTEARALAAPFAAIPLEESMSIVTKLDLAWRHQTDAMAMLQAALHEASSVEAIVILRLIADQVALRDRAAELAGAIGEQQ